MLRVVLTIALLLSAGTGTLADVSGTWRVTMEGEKRPIEGTLVLQRKGAELSGLWKSLDDWTLIGRVDDTGRFVLQSEPRPVPMTNGTKKGSIAARWVFRGALKDGGLSGTASIEIENTEPRVRKWTAVMK